MNKRAIFGMVFILGALLIAGFFVFWHFNKDKIDSPLSEGSNESVNVSRDIAEGTECEKDEDCIRVRTTCCSCDMGGEERCVPEYDVETYYQKIANCPQATICAAMYNCNVKYCKCVDKKCVGQMVNQ